MSEFTGETLYALLPAFYRTRDAAQGWPLRALLGLVEHQVVAIEADIAKLYDNWFIETCEEWVVPYIGDLLDVRQLRPLTQDASSSALFTRRGYVANTLGYRRRKGTAALLEQLAHDVAGWPCVAVEFFQALATTQHVNHTRLHNRTTVDVRAPEPLERIGGPFERASHTLEVRRAGSDRGKYNVPSIGLYLWRLAALELEDVVAVEDAGGGERFRFDPMGADRVLFNRSELPSRLGAANREADLPGALRRRALHADLEAVRQALAETGVAPPSSYLGAEPAFAIRIASEAAAIPAAQIAICDLSSWRLPITPRPYTRRDGSVVNLPIRVAVDPVNGRLAFPSGITPAEVRTSFSYGFSAPIGGGTFARTLTPRGVRAIYIVAGGGTQLAAALATWHTERPTSAVVEIEDSLTYALPPALDLPAGLALEIRAAAGQRPLVAAADPTHAWELTLAAGARLALDGLAIAAGLELDATGDAALAITDVTLVPGRALTPAGEPALPGAASLVATETGGTLAVEIRRSIVGPVRLPLEDPTSLVVSESSLAIADSIVDAMGGVGAALVAVSATVERCTVLGASAFTVLVRASDALFTEPVTVDRTQAGCCRFSFLPDGSKVPRAYRCQPRLALDAGAAVERPAILDRVQPSFTSERFGDPGYAQLDRDCASEIRTGAEDDSEMGAFQSLHQPQREANLRAAVQEYLRLGLEAGLFLVT